jgi:hypothetical protein
MTDTTGLGRPHQDDDQQRHTLTVHQVSEHLADAGVPRSERQIKRYCESGFLDDAKKVPGPTGDQWFVAPIALPKLIGDLQQWQMQRAGHSETRPAMSLDNIAESLPQRVERLRAAWQTSRVSDGKRAAEANTSILKAAFARSSSKRVPADAVLDALFELGIELALQNDNVFDFPAVDLGRSLTASEARYVTDQLIEVQARIEHDGRIHALFSDGLCGLFAGLLEELPASAFQEQAASFTVPLYSLVDPAALVSSLLTAFLQELVPETPDSIAALPFMRTRLRLWQNLLDVSRMTPEQLETAAHKIVAPKDCDLSPPEMIHAYLGGTPLAPFVETRLPFTIPLEKRLIPLRA